MEKTIEQVAALTNILSTAFEAYDLNPDGKEEIIEEAIEKITGYKSNQLLFTEQDLSQLQSEVHKITGDGKVMQLFNKMLGVSS